MPMHSAGDIVHLVLKVLLVLGLVAVNGFFVAAEFALVRIRATQLDMLVVRGNRRAKLARSIITNLNTYLSATQLGITMASLGLGWVGQPVFSALLAPVLVSLHLESQTLRDSIAFAFGFLALTFLHISAGELAPKWAAIQNSLPISLFVARPLTLFYRASYPFNWLLNLAARWLVRQAGIEMASEGGRAHSEEELRLLLTTAQTQAGATPLGRDILLNALDLRRRVAREVMRPRQEIVALDTEASIAECLDVAEKTRYSRFPLCEGGDLDRTLGVVHIKDLYAMRIKAHSGADLLSAVRKLVYVPGSARLEKLLHFFLERKLHLAIVVDEFGGAMGMVTLENILEELVGQIQDEFDQEKPLLARIDDNSWDVTGILPLHELEEIVGEPLREEGITTVSGWVTQRLGGFPKPGDTVAIGSCELRVEEIAGMRVARLRLSRKPAKLESLKP
jgi:CBS domain containing-hemolysin-like protein